MRFRLIAFFLTFSVLAVSASDNYDMLTHAVIRAIVTRDSAGLVALLPQKMVCYPLDTIRTDTRLQKLAKDFSVQTDGYYKYEKKLAAVPARQGASFLTANCAGMYNRDAYPVAESDFTQVNIAGKNRVEIVCKALCGVSKLHLVFVRKDKSTWAFAGVFWEAARKEGEGREKK